MDAPDTTEQPPATPTAPDETTADHGSLRGSFVAVLLMTAFFLLAWFGVLAIAMERR